MNTGQDLDQAGLAGPVVSEDARHLAGANLHRDVLQRDDAAEVLADMPHLEQGRAVCGVGHLGTQRLALAARRLTSVFTPTARKRITPRNVKYQLESQPAKMI